MNVVRCTGCGEIFAVLPMAEDEVEQKWLAHRKKHDDLEAMLWR